MRIAFYAPLKPLDHSTPSGDRAMARAFFTILQDLGHAVEVASPLRSYDRSGDPVFQAACRKLADAEAARLVAAYGRGEHPELWFTYHAYHKAPDWLGPVISRALGIPYVVAEASIAGKQAGGKWDLGHRATIEAVEAAALILAMTKVDAQGLAAHLSDRRKLQHFPPFLLHDLPSTVLRHERRSALAAELSLAEERPWLVTVAMMRADAKLDSYHLLAASLERLVHRDWQLLVVGDGEAAPAVRRALAAAAGERVRLLGRQPPAVVADICLAGDLFVWPALREAYGMAILEALAAGLPVVACREGGVPDLVEDGLNGLLAADRSADELATRIDCLLRDATLRRKLGAHARERYAECHSRAAAAARLETALSSIPGLASAPACG